VAGALGSAARYGLDGLISRRTSGAFPWGTFAVNMTGSFALGLVFTVLTERWAVAPWLRSSITIGFFGAYTTFSTLMLESYRLGSDRELGLGALNVLGSCAVGLLAVYVGVVAGRAM
jgi:fluoride exporter